MVLNTIVLDISSAISLPNEDSTTTYGANVSVVIPNTPNSSVFVLESSSSEYPSRILIVEPLIRPSTTEPDICA